MGADLYLGSLIEPRQKKYRPHYEHWIRVRDQATSEGAQLRAQLRASHFFDLMYATGHYRDGYNEHNLLEKFGLTWWEDVGPRLTAEGCLELDQIAWLMQILEQRRLVFYANIARDEDCTTYLRGTANCDPSCVTRCDGTSRSSARCR